MSFTLNKARRLGKVKLNCGCHKKNFEFSEAKSKIFGYLIVIPHYYACYIV